MSPPINLPDGSEVSEVILPDGASASEVIAPDGSTVFSAIPGSGVARFDFEDDSDATTAVDSWFDNTLSINGASYTSTSAVGASALDHSGGDHNAIGDQTVDIAGNNVAGEFSLSAQVQLASVESSSTLFGWQSDSGGVPGILFGTESGGNWRIIVRSGGSNETVDTGISQTTGSFVKLGLTVKDQTLRAYVEGSGTTRDIDTIVSNDPTAAGSGGKFVIGSTADGVNFSDLIIDAFEIHDERKSDNYMTTEASE